MATRADVRQARVDFDKHCAEHKCKAGECPERIRLWFRIGELALQWQNT
jgi:hypothetical protein